MSVYTSADRHRDSALDCINNAIEDLEEMLRLENNDPTFKISYIETIECSLHSLHTIRRDIKGSS